MSQSNLPGFTGRHVLAEFEGLEPALLDDPARLSAMLSAALSESGATVLQVITHRFAPQGVTVLAMLAESHASIHTYPEMGSAFVDVFTCGDQADPEHALKLLADALDRVPSRQETVRRGLE